MLCSPLRETGPIYIPDVEPEVFEQLLRFIYYEAFEPNGDSIFALLYAAKKYAVMCLVDRCLKWLEERLSSDNVCVVLEQAHAFDERDLRGKCIEFIMDNGSSVFKHPSFRNLSSNCVEMVLKQNQLEVNEEEVYEAMKDWAVNECDRKKIEPSVKNIRDVLGGLRYLIRFAGINIQYFADKVAADEILNPQEKVHFFRGFHGSSNLAVTRFINTKRKPRFQKMETVSWFSGSDTMEFKSSVGFLLSGIVIQGAKQAAHGPFDLNIEVMLMDEPKHSIMSKTFRTNLLDGQLKEILFVERVVLHCSWYSITLRSSTRGDTRDNNSKGVIKLGDGQSIEFRNSSLSRNSTSDLSCTISGLLICRRLQTITVSYLGRNQKNMQGPRLVEHVLDSTPID